MLELPTYLKDFRVYFPHHERAAPWQFIGRIQEHIIAMLTNLETGYQVNGNVAVHNTALIEEGVVLKGPLIISPGCFVGAHAYFRGGVFLGKDVSIGPGCEVKSSIVLDGSRLAHFNFTGDSLIGSDVNMEAGSVLANYHNDRKDKAIYLWDGTEYQISGTSKFGGLIGDHSRIGANAVCSPGTVLAPRAIVKRLELIEQDRDRPQ
jgi:NDP-sugar pyrophosphorylase family protein